MSTNSENILKAIGADKNQSVTYLMSKGISDARSGMHCEYTKRTTN